LPSHFSSTVRLAENNACLKQESPWAVLRPLRLSWSCLSRDFRSCGQGKEIIAAQRMGFHLRIAIARNDIIKLYISISFCDEYISKGPGKSSKAWH
jgi:hypothetical protein